MLVHAFVAVVLSLASTGSGVSTQTIPITVPPEATFNEFLPEERSLGDCISALPKPGCGSKARGGWHQTLVLVAMLGGLVAIVTFVVIGSRRARRA